MNFKFNDVLLLAFPPQKHCRLLRPAPFGIHARQVEGLFSPLPTLHSGMSIGEPSWVGWPQIGVDIIHNFGRIALQ